MTIFHRLLLCVAFIAFAMVGKPASAQYRLIVPTIPSGPIAVFARELAQNAGNSLGQQVVIDFRAGGGGVVGLENFLSLPTDGRSYLMMSPQTMIYAHGQNKSRLLEQIRGVSVLGIGGYAIVVPASQGVSDLAGLIQQGRARSLSIGQFGVATIDAVCARQFAAITGMGAASFISYNNSEAVMSSLIGGVVNVACASISVVMPHVASGRVRALAVTLPFASGNLPGVPTLDSAGIQGVVRGNWYALVAPRGASASAIEHMVSAIGRALSDMSVLSRLQAAGLEPVPADDVNPDIAEAFLSKQNSLLAPYGKLVQ